MLLRMKTYYLKKISMERIYLESYTRSNRKLMKEISDSK